MRILVCAFLFAAAVLAQQPSTSPGAGEFYGPLVNPAQAGKLIAPLNAQQSATLKELVRVRESVKNATEARDAKITALVKRRVAGRCAVPLLEAPRPAAKDAINGADPRPAPDPLQTTPPAPPCPSTR
jgi:hypothetical protein